MNEFMAFSQERILREYSTHSQESYRLIINESNRSSARRAGYVFLSHSNRDKVLARAFVEMMIKRGTAMYIDLYDSTLSLPPSKEMARQLRDRIKDAKRIILLATQNSVHGSTWCPWEVGVGDGLGKEVCVAVTKDTNGVTYGAEYLNLYPMLCAKPDNYSGRPRMALMECSQRLCGIENLHFARWF